MRERLELENYRIYVTDRLFTLCGWSGNAPRLRYYDALYPAPEDRRTSEEIAQERLSMYGIKVVG